MPRVKKSQEISEEKIFEYGWQMFSHLTDQIQYADTKASLILGADALLLGTLSALVAGRGNHIVLEGFTPLELISVILLCLALLSLFISIFYSLLVARPSMKSQRTPGLFYFKMIRVLSREKFIERFEGMTAVEVRRDLLSQVHTLANITQTKFGHNSLSLNFLLYSLYLWGIGQLLLIFS